MTEKGFLYLYPIQEYVDSVVGEKDRRFSHAEKTLDRLNEIIDTRYRQRGYQVYWLHFGQDENPEESDTSLASDEVATSPEDISFSCGLSFHDHVSDLKYPDPDRILDQLDPEIKELFVGGFHQWDCVDKVARAAYERGINVLVDEDTTEVFLLSGKGALKAPLIRDPFVFQVHEDWVEISNDMRPDVPWFTKLVAE